MRAYSPHRVSVSVRCNQKNIKVALLRLEMSGQDSLCDMQAEQTQPMQSVLVCFDAKGAVGILYSLSCANLKMWFKLNTNNQKLTIIHFHHLLCLKDFLSGMHNALLPDHQRPIKLN